MISWFLILGKCQQVRLPLRVRLSLLVLFAGLLCHLRVYGEVRSQSARRCRVRFFWVSMAPG